MPDDALAPAAAAPVAAPAPAAAPAPPPSSAPVAQPAAAPLAAAAPAPQDDYSRLLSSLGYQDVEGLKADLEFNRNFRAEAERVRQQRLANDPARQQATQRGEALRQLVAEGYSPEIAESLNALPEIQQFLNGQRADGAQRDLDSALGDIGLRFDDTKDSQDMRQAWEDAIADRIASNRGYRERYFGTPAERKAVIRDVVALEERRINHVLLRQNAQTLRDHAARQTTTAPGRGTLPTVRPPTVTATEPAARAREMKAERHRQLQDIHAAYH